MPEQVLVGERGQRAQRVQHATAGRGHRRLVGSRDVGEVGHDLVLVGGHQLEHRHDVHARRVEDVVERVDRPDDAPQRRHLDVRAAHGGRARVQGDGWSVAWFEYAGRTRTRRLSRAFLRPRTGQASTS